MKKTTPFLFADDTNLFKSGSNVNEIKCEIESELANISEWLKVNKLSLNIQKTKFMIFANRNSKF